MKTPAFILMFYAGVSQAGELPLKESSSNWFWQGLYALFIAAVLLSIAVILIWWLRKKLALTSSKNADASKSITGNLFPNQRIQILASKKISVKSKVTLIQVDQAQYLICESSANVQLIPHLPADATATSTSKASGL